MPNNDSHQHVVKTTEQWNDRAVEYWVVPRGCLCIELTPNRKTKLKVGEGNKFYSQLPYITGEDLSEYYTKTEVDNIIANINKMCIASTEEYDDKSDLPITDNTIGDVRFVKSSSPSIKLDPDIYLWDGTKWIFVGYDFKETDLSQYLKKEEFHQLFDPVKDQVDEMYPKMHTHSNKAVLDQTTAPYTIPEKEKLAGLHNYDDTEIRELIHESSHTHDNKALLDTITSSNQLWSQSDRDKFDDLHNYDDGPITSRVTTLESKAHTHENKEFLDTIIAPYQIWSIEDRDKFDSLSNPEVFVGTDGYYAGRKGLVPAPKITDIGKFLSSDGNWEYVEGSVDFVGATASTNGIHGLVPAPEAGQEDYFLKADGTWAEVSSGEQYLAGDGIEITNSGSEIIVTDPAYYFDTQVQCVIDGRTFTKYNDEPALGIIVYNQSGYTGPLFFGLTEDSVKLRQSYDSGIIGCRGSFEYLGYTWYYSNFEYWMHGDWTDSSGHIEKLSGSYDLSNDAVISMVGQIVVNLAGVIPSDQKIISAKIGTGLMFDEDDAIRTTANPANYVADDGIEFTQTITPPTVDDWTAANAGYYFDNQVTCYLSRSYKKTYDGPALCCVMNMVRNGDPVYDMFLVSPVLQNVTFECNGNVFVPSSSNYVMYKGLKWYYSNWDYAWGGTSGSDTSGNLISLPLSGGTPPTTLADAALLLLQTADVIGVEHGAPTYAVSAKIGSGLRFDANDAIEAIPYELPPATTSTLGGIKVGEGLSIAQDGTLDVISEAVSPFEEGDGIEFSEESIPLAEDITHIMWKISNIRDRSINMVQVEEIEFYDINDQLLTFSAISGEFDLVGGGTGTPEYGTTGYQQTPDKLVDGDNTHKCCCTNFNSNVEDIRFIFELDTPLGPTDFKEYRWMTADDETGRDPISWKMYVSADGNNWIQVDEASGATIPTARTTNTEYYIPTEPTVVERKINVKYGEGLTLNENGELVPKLGVGLTFDNDNAIEFDETIDLVFNCDYTD